ncbi:hypothetical protein [Streptomyces sp. NPDC048825]|uniref:hypothetical protein n=1 Tax=Streptomyces sp. NPDC048825 TaxID=3365592 RepID=UPI00372007C5
MARHGLRIGAARPPAGRTRCLDHCIVIAGGVLALVLWNYPTPEAVALVLVLGLVVLVLALLGILAAASGAAEHPAPGGQPVIRPG